MKVHDPEAVALYRFATKTTDFIICSICGVYVGAAVTVAGQAYATLNMNVTDLEAMNATPIVHYDEPSALRVERRVNSFTPFVNYPF